MTSPSIVTVPRPLAAAAAWCCAGRSKKKKQDVAAAAGEATATAVPPSPRPSPTHTARATLRLPAPSDACLLAACLAWPPSLLRVRRHRRRGRVLVARARMHGRKSAASLAPRDALVPFWAYTLLVYAEAAVMLGVLLHRGEPWAAPYVTAAAARGRRVGVRGRRLAGR